MSSFVKWQKDYVLFGFNDNLVPEILPFEIAVHTLPKKELKSNFFLESQHYIY